MRGYSAIGLFNVKRDTNIGGAMRAAHCFGASLIVLTGHRYQYTYTNTTKAENSIPLIEVDDLFDAIPYGCVPVAVEISDESRSLVEYTHPLRAFYIFGPEDGSVPSRIMQKCRDVVSIPTRYCLNLAAAVNVVLYDRIAKGGVKGL